MKTIAWLLVYHRQNHPYQLPDTLVWLPFGKIESIIIAWHEYSPSVEVKMGKWGSTVVQKIRNVSYEIVHPKPYYNRLLMPPIPNRCLPRSKVGENVKKWDFLSYIHTLCCGSEEDALLTRGKTEVGNHERVLIGAETPKIWGIVSK